MSLRFTIGCFTTEWQRLERGITTGCNISLILFVMGMNLIIIAAEKETKGPKTSTGTRISVNGGFIDDITITRTTHVHARWVLDALDETIMGENADQAQVVKKPNTIKKRTVTKKFALKIQDVDKPSIVEKPVKCLVKWFDSKLKDRET